MWMMWMALLIVAILFVAPLVLPWGGPLGWASAVAGAAFLAAAVVAAMTVFDDGLIEGRGRADHLDAAMAAAATMIGCLIYSTGLILRVACRLLPGMLVSAMVGRPRESVSAET